MAKDTPILSEKACEFCGRMFRKPKGFTRQRFAERRFCSRPCMGKGTSRPWEERFADYILPEPNSGCWLWTAALFRGYGVFCKRGTKTTLAHRLSYEMANGPIPQGMHVRHHCDTPCCVNPDHLAVGTHADNMADAVARKRHAVGTAAGGAKLTDEQVRAIRNSPLPLSAMMRSYGVSKATISEVRRNVRWRHVE